jgi:hypothetical protein
MPGKTRKTPRKKSQMELMGLAIVVLLLLVGLTFAIRFVVLKKPNNFKKGFIDTELASNTLNTFLKTNSRDCRKLTMSELIQDCAKGYPGTIDCNDDILITNFSCNYVEDTAASIFSNTLGRINARYQLLAYTQDTQTTPFIEIGQRCQADKKSKTFLVPSTVTVNVRLDIC